MTTATTPVPPATRAYADVHAALLRGLHDRHCPCPDDDRRGQLSATSPGVQALHDTFVYQHGHMLAVEHELRRRFDPSGQDVAIIDVGAGAATVALAAARAWDGDPPRRAQYIGFEPNQQMRSLGELLLRQLRPSWMTARLAGLAAAGTAAFAGRPDRFVVAMSYVAHQETFSDEQAASLARGVVALSAHAPVDVLSVTANSSVPTMVRRDSDPAFDAALRGSVAAAERRLTRRTRTTRRHTAPYPLPGGGWRTYTPDRHNVRVTHWQVAA